VDAAERELRLYVTVNGKPPVFPEAELEEGEEKMATSKSYTKALIRELKDPREAAEYLSMALEDGNMEVFLLALKDVAEALGGGFSKLSRKTHLNRENLYRMLSDKGNPELRSMGALLGALGLKLSVDVKKAS
jgi:probable addiction module antidote protein